MGNRAVYLLIGLALAGCSSISGRAPSKFMVFFSGNSAQLSPEGRAIVGDAAVKIRSEHPASVLIAAGVLSGDAIKLSQPRFAVVRQALVDEGISSDLIARSPIPDVSLSTADATANQRVEIRLLKNAP